MKTLTKEQRGIIYDMLRAMLGTLGKNDYAARMMVAALDSYTRSITIDEPTAQDELKED